MVYHPRQFAVLGAYMKQSNYHQQHTVLGLAKAVLVKLGRLAVLKFCSVLLKHARKQASKQVAEQSGHLSSL